MANELIPPKQFFDELDRSCESKIAACERQVDELAEINKELLEAVNALLVETSFNDDWTTRSDEYARLKVVAAKAEQ
jgi:hypothetical protein